MPSTLPIHPSAQGYDGSHAQLYETVRPSYPPATLDYIAGELKLGAGTRVLDLGAGTGKLSRLLAATGAQVVGLEPVAGMRQEFARLLPACAVLGAASEAIPMRGGTVDAVTAGQSFHWFANPTTLAEIRRVLTPGGHLCLLWNMRVESAAWLAELWRIVDRYEGDTPRHRDGGWKALFRQSPDFPLLAQRAFAWAQPIAPALVLGRIASISFIACPRQT